MILPCNCKNLFQDKTYGVGRRVHNACKKADTYRCANCKAEKVHHESKLDKKDKE